MKDVIKDAKHVATFDL